MDKELTIKERILAFLESQSIKKVDFFETTGIQSSNFKGKNMQSQPGGDTLVKVLKLYPALSAEWLMRGEGEMLKNVVSAPFPLEDNSEDKGNLLSPSERVIDKLLTTTQEQAEEIGKLKEQIKQLIMKKDTIASPVNTSNIANAG